jgi:HEAT repeat protein
MEPTQFDLFADLPPAPRHESSTATVRVVAEELSDAALIAVLPDASLGDACALAAEAGRRRLGDAVAALAALCRRFVGFGLDRRVPEQIAALKALSAIGGPEAARAVHHIIVKHIVQGPNLAAAVIAAAGLGAKLTPDVALPLLRHADPSVRAAACGCVRAGGEVVPALIALLTECDDEIATAAACALGRMGRAEARDPLKRCLLAKPSARVIEALAGVADEEAIVFLARLGRKRPDLANCILAALEEIDLPAATTAASALASWLSRSDRG